MEEGCSGMGDSQIPYTVMQSIVLYISALP